MDSTNSNNNNTASNKIEDIVFVPIKIGDYCYNVNRNGDMHILTDFSDMFPIYDDIAGPSLKISTQSGEVIVPLNNHVVKGMIIENCKKMDDTTYLKAFIERKAPIVKHLISQTFSKGFQTPSAVQALACIELAQGKDVCVQSKSGTGKTQAFLFGLSFHFDDADPNAQHMYITSTHEVADQIYKQAKFLLPPGTKMSLCVGQKKDDTTGGGFRSSGANTGIKKKSMREEMEEIKGAQIVIGTMGKIYDYFVNKKWIDPSYLKSICIDEFDKIVTSDSRKRSSTVMSTEDQLAAIMKRLNQDTQRAFFSATVSNDAVQVAHGYFRPENPDIGAPFLVFLDTNDYTLKGIRQYYVPCQTTEIKLEVTMDLLAQCRISQGIIFANTKETAHNIKAYLDRQKIQITSEVFHGSLTGDERKSIHQAFIDNKFRLLISTDLTARGLDIQGINVVINFDMPNDLETYIHRVGRSGRYGRKGVAISLILVNNNVNQMKNVAEINHCSLESEMIELPQDLSNLL